MEAIRILLERNRRSLFTWLVGCATVIPGYAVTQPRNPCTGAPWSHTERNPNDPDSASLLLAAENPLQFLRACRAEYDATIVDYSCQFIKQERIRGKIRDEQVVRVEFRERPFSVDMQWIKNPGRASRVCYVAGRWVENNRPMAHIEPSGFLGLLVPAVKRDIHGAEALAESRRTIDQFGFKNTLDLIIQYSEQARAEATLVLNFKGIETFRDRKCFVFDRLLPYTGETGRYPDRRLLVYIDHEWRVPIGVLTYADDKGRDLLGRYEFSDLKFNIGLTDRDF